MKYAFFGGCNVGGSPDAIAVLGRALDVAALYGARPVVVGDLFHAPEAQVMSTLDMIHALRLMARDPAPLFIAGYGDTHTPGEPSGPAAFFSSDTIVLRSRWVAELGLVAVAADGTDFQPGLFSAERGADYLMAAVLPRGTDLTMVATLLADQPASMVVLGGQVQPGEVSTFGSTIVALGQLCPAGFDGSGFNAGRILIYDADANEYDWEEVAGPRYHVATSIDHLRRILDATNALGRCHIQLRVQPGDTETSEAVAIQLIRARPDLDVQLEVVPDLLETRRSAISAAASSYRGASHVEAVRAWFVNNEEPRAVQDRVFTYLAKGV